jgi:hypothetical protein
MYDRVRLDIQPSRYGFLVVPYLPQLKFDYNHVYNSIDDVIMDFELHNFKFNGFIDGYYEFDRVDQISFE